MYNPIIIAYDCVRQIQGVGDCTFIKVIVSTCLAASCGPALYRCCWNNPIIHRLTCVRWLKHITDTNCHMKVHTLISGRGRYVLIHADEPGTKKRIETFVVGTDVTKGEKSVWIVEGGKYKASFLLDGAEGERLLISEVCAFTHDQ